MTMSKKCVNCNKEINDEASCLFFAESKQEVLDCIAINYIIIIDNKYELTQKGFEHYKQEAIQKYGYWIHDKYCQCNNWKQKLR